MKTVLLFFLAPHRRLKTQTLCLLIEIPPGGDPSTPTLFPLFSFHHQLVFTKEMFKFIVVGPQTA